MVVNSVGAFPPRAVDRSQFVQNRWNPYASDPSEPTMSLSPGYGFESPGALYHPLNHHQHSHHPSLHPLVAAADGSQGYGMKFTSTGEGYGASAHGGVGTGGGGYDYHPPPPPPPIIHHPLPPLWPAPTLGGKSKGKGAALSALTLLAFLYFLNMLQSCLKDHMDTMNPTVMVMTAGATRRKDSIDRLDSSLEQATIGSGEEEAPRDEGSSQEGPGEVYEKLSKRYQLLTSSSNRTRNPFNRPSNRPRKKSPAPRPSHHYSYANDDSWFDRSSYDRRD